LLKQSAFFDFLNRRPDTGFVQFLQQHVEDEHYIDWNGFVLPHDYGDGDAEREYSAIRESCALCDVSPMRKIRVSGLDAGRFFDHLLTRPVSNLPVMRGTYVIFCNDDGSLKDDAILYKYADNDYLLMPSDVDHSPYFESVRKRFDLGNVSFTECTNDWVGLAIQGPRSAGALHAMGFAGIEQLAPFFVRDFKLDTGIVKISRMGFTADLGYEMWFAPGLADSVMKKVRAARAEMGIELPGYGLDALQVCRIEGGFIVAGWDCATEIDPQPGFERSPFELGLGWLVNLDASEFVGRYALQEEKNNGSRFTLRSVAIDQKCSPVDGCSIFDAADPEGDPIGIVTCSSWSWGMQQLIGNASIKTERAGTKNASLVVDGERIPVLLSQGPLVDFPRRNQVPAPLEI